MFVCLEGIDGAGKTSTARILVDELRASGRLVCLAEHNRYRARTPFADSHLQGLRSLQAASSESFGYVEVSELHWILLKASYYSLADQHVITPALEAGQIVVADGWYFKFAARIASNGTMSMAEVVRHYGDVSQPSLVFLLDIEPGVAADRLGTFNCGELGRANVGTTQPAVAFTEFQSAVRAELLGFASSHGWVIVPVSRRSARQAAALIKEQIEHCQRAAEPTAEVVV